MEMTRNEQRAVAAEFLGTLFFVLLGTGAVVSALAGAGGDAALVAISIAHGIGIVVAVAWTASLSGGHINPAVTVAMLVAGKIKAPLAGAYIVAQLAGALAGSLILKLVIPNDLEIGLGRHSLNPDMNLGEGFLLEAVLTFFLVLVIFNTAVSKKGWGDNAPLAIGLAVMLIHFAAVPWTGASVNPARSFGPAIMANEWGDGYFGDFLALYVLAPILGAVAMAAAWTFWRSMGDPDDALD